MNIIFLGYMVPLDKMNQYSGISVAGNKMQYNILNELNKLEDVTVYSISMSPYACYPKDKHIMVKEAKYIYNNISCVEVKYLNLPIFKQITQIFFVYNEAKRLMARIVNKDELLVVGFNMFPQVGIPLKKIRRYAKTLCVLADLPIDDNVNRKGISKWLRAIFDHNTKKNIASCDNYIVLSECIKKEHLADKNVIVIEGGISEDDVANYAEVRKKNKKTVIVFSGALTEYNGVITLIEAMKYLQSESVELRIYGDGYLKDYVMKSQEENTQIKYYGQVSNVDIKRYQREADILINPRQVDNAISRYTFPSKTFEYFLSKTIVVSTKIPSYPDEYLDKMILAEDSPEGIANAIWKAMNMSREEKKRLADRAYSFVTTEKKWSNQIAKMYEYMESILNE